MPRFLARENQRQVPIAALWLTNIVIQLFLLVSFFAEYAFILALKMTSVMTLVPYLLVAAYGFKLAATGETYDTQPGQRRVDWVRASIATLYAALMLIAGGPKFVLISAIMYAFGTILYVIARREQGQRLFTVAESIVFGVVSVAAATGVFALATGLLTI
jgi:arginine:ornithine antiporter/lysine permease